MAKKTRAELWQEIAGERLGEPVIASVILMRRGMLRDQMLGGLNPVSGVLGGVVGAVAEAGVDLVKQEMERRLPVKPIAVDGYAYVALGATKFGIIKPAQSVTTADALRRGKVVLLVPRTVPIKFTVGKKGFIYRDVVLEVGGFAPTPFKAQWRHFANLEKVVALLQS
jgi:hypothetical protein